MPVLNIQVKGMKKVRKAAKKVRQFKRDLEQCELLAGNMGYVTVVKEAARIISIRNLEFAESGEILTGEIESTTDSFCQFATSIKPVRVDVGVRPMETAPKDRLILLGIPGRWVSDDGKFMSVTPEWKPGGESVIYGEVPEPTGWSELPGAIRGQVEGAHEEATRFELGKCYKHSAGSVMKIVGSANTFFHGICLVGEDQHGELQTVGNSIESITGWVEIDGCDFHPENVGGERHGRI